MKFISKALITASLAIAIIGTTVPLTATSAEAGPKGNTGSSSVSGQSIGSGR